MSALMSVGQSAMFASYAALQTTGNNIANANTAGYSRQTANLADAPGQFTGAGYFGKGVNVTGISRAYDQHLTNAAVVSASTAAADSARLDKLSQLEAVFSSGTAGMGYAAGQFLNAFVDLSNTPADSSARQVVLSQAQDLAAKFRAAGDQLSALQTTVTQDVRSAAESVNALARQVAALNHEIAGLAGSGQPPNQLLDQRDLLVSQIAKYVNVTSVNAADGSVGLFVGGGQNLVLGATASTMKAVADPFDPAKVQLALREGGVDRMIPTDTLAGGSISGLLRFQNSDLTDANNLLGQMAAAISGGINQQQSLGLDLRQPAGAGAPIFAVGTPQVRSNSANTGSAALTVSVADSSQLQASDYALSFDGSNYALTSNLDQQAVPGSPFTAAQMAAGVSFDGVTLRLASGTAQAGDRFLVQPVASAAQGMSAVLRDPKGLAAASPFTASANVNNTGTAMVASVVAVNPGYNGSLSASIAFTSNSGDYTWSLSNGTTGTGTWTAGTPIRLNGFELKIDGVPASGDALSVAPTVATAGNNGNALAFVALGTKAMVGVSANSPGQSLTDAYAGTLANIGVRVQGGKTASQMSQAIATDAETARSNKAGVNLDEEAARLIQFQQSYQAAAKILQVAQAIFQTMLQAGAA